MSEDVPEEPARQELRRQFRFAAVIGGVSLLIISWYLDSLSPHHQIHNLLSISGLLLLIIGLHAQSAEKALTVVESLADWLGMGAIHMLGLLYAFFLALITRSAAGDAKIAHVNAHTAIWFMSILLATLVTLDWTRIREYRKPSIDQISLLGFVLVSAFTLRAFMITEIPFGVTGDEGGTGFAALDYLSGSRTNILASGWFEFPALYYWIASKFLSLIGDRLLAIRLISAVGGTLAVSALYFALSKMFTREHAAIGASLLAINHVHIVFSRGAMNNIWDGVFIMVAVGALWQAWKTNDRNAFILTGLALGFSQFFYTTGHLTPVYILLWIPLLQREYPIRERLPGLILAFTIATIIFLPLGMHYINQPEKLLIPMKRVSILNADWVKTTSQVTGKSAYQLFSEQFRYTLKGLTQTTVRGIYNPGKPILLCIDATLFFAGLGLAAVQFWKPQFSILLLGLFGPILAGTFSVEAPSSQRLLYTLPFLAALISIALVTLRKYLSKLIRTHTLALPVLVFLILSGSAYSNLNFLFREAMPDQRYSDRGAYFSRALSDFLNQQPAGIQARMVIPAPIAFESIPSLVYLAPEVSWRNIDWYQLDVENLKSGDTHMLFVFQKQNADWSEPLIRKFPEATIYTQNDHYDRLLFKIVEIKISESSLQQSLRASSGMIMPTEYQVQKR
ncbi:MAG: glycosyltransferase family 39 protein [Anaerolineales bacterium]|jgi:hypothetical protein